MIVVTTAAQPVAIAGVDLNGPLDRAADADEALEEGQAEAKSAANTGPLFIPCPNPSGSYKTPRDSSSPHYGDVASFVAFSSAALGNRGRLQAS